jgi:predicted nucleic acid-binding protein
MTKVLIDSDIILDLFLDREPFADDSEQIFEILAAGRARGHVTVAALLNIYYVIRKTLGRKAALNCMQHLLETDGLEILSVDKRHILAAADSGMPDFEDAVQAAAAEVAEIDYIVTRNRRDFRYSPVPALSPEDFLEKMQ